MHSGSVSDRIGGNIRNKEQFWKSLTQDDYILSAVAGAHLEFAFGLPVQDHIPNVINCSDKEHKMLSIEIGRFLGKGFIEEATHSPGEFISYIFPRPKPDGSIRIILNLSSLNEFIEYNHFKMETIQTVLPLIAKGDFFASIDLKDAYYTVPICAQHRKFLRFMWNDKLYQFTCMPMGLSSAPRLFTKLLKPIFCMLRKKGFLSVYYLDDTLLIANTYARCLENVTATASILSKAGFIINHEKSVFMPTKEIKFLGFLLNSDSMTIRLPSKKITQIVGQCKTLLERPKLQIRDLASFIGTVVATFPAVHYGPLYYRELEFDKICALKMNKGNFDAFTTLSAKAKEEILWWKTHVHASFKSIIDPPFTSVLTTDASLDGWGAVFDEIAIGGRWTKTEASLHINALELKAVLLALESFCKTMHDDHIRVKSDNVTAVTYINKMGGTKSKSCNMITKLIWEFCMKRNLLISAEHLPGVNNIQADLASRKFNDDIEWSLKDQYFCAIVKEFGQCDIDLFATRLNKKCDRFVSWKPEPQACFVDAFCHSWIDYKFYAFPPFSLVPHCLSKIIREGSEGVLVAPLWVGQPWFPKLLTVLMDFPLILPEGALYLPHQEGLHPLENTLRLLVCHVSGNSMKTRDFRQNRCPLSCRPGGNLPLNSTRHILESGVLSAMNGKLILCKILKSMSSNS